MTKCAAIFLVSIVLVGCDGFETPTLVTFVGELVPAPEAGSGDPVSGPVRMVTGAGFTEVRIEVRDQPPSRRLRWSVRGGRCDGSGDPLGPPGDFPEIVVGEAGGTGGTLTVFNRNVPETRDYSAQVLDLEDRLLACGDLILP